MTVTTRLFDALLGSVCVTRNVADAREAWRLVSLAARVGAHETWTFVSTPQAPQTSIAWIPGIGLCVGSIRVR
jgi:hypothetical protein